MSIKFTHNKASGLGQSKFQINPSVEIDSGLGQSKCQLNPFIARVTVDLVSPNVNEIHL